MNYKLIQVEDYEQFVGFETIKRIKEKAKPLQGLHVTNINSTYYGGGVAQILSSLTLLMNSIGIKTGWRAIHGPPDFFSVTKKCTTPFKVVILTLVRKKEKYTKA